MLCWSPLRPVEDKEVENRDDFTIVARKNRELVSVHDKGKRAEVITNNSFGSLRDVGEGDKWALSIVDGSLPPLRVNDSDLVLMSKSLDGIPLGAKAPI